MPLVLDASVALGALFPDERSSQADAILAQLQSDEAVVPAHWWFETRNALIVAERRGRVSRDAVTAFLIKLNDLPVSIAALPDEKAVFALAHDHRLTFYDAAYLELAKREEMTLATFDRELIAAAKAEQVPLA